MSEKDSKTPAPIVSELALAIREGWKEEGRKEVISEFVKWLKEIHHYYLGWIDNYQRGGILSEMEEKIKEYEGKLK